MPKDFKCALSSRAGRTLLLGDQRISIDAQGFVRGVDGAALSYFQSQPGIWLEIGQAQDKAAGKPVAAPVRQSKPEVVPAPRARQHKAPEGVVTLPLAASKATVQLPTSAAKVTLPKRSKRKA